MAAMGVRVRFAPSPTGFFSLGNARTALFNWLFARHEGGEFLVRIEDTDKERSTKEYEEDILSGLRFLGLAWDGELTRQSERLGIYEKYLSQLIEEKKAYYCFCTEEELAAEHEALLSQGVVPVYSGRCRRLSPEETEKKLKEGTPSVIRFTMPRKTISFTDIIRGKVEFKTELLGDIIIAKSLREPLYNFANAIDDHEMGITHVIRGEDHLSNTPKQIAVQEALGFEKVHYAHLPLILGPDKKKLSKRYAAASIGDYKRAGFVSGALVNFLALLGWHPEKDREVLSREELIAEFKLERAQKGGAVFNEEKLRWLNAHYLKTMDAKAFLEAAKPFMPEEWGKDREKLMRALPLVRERITAFGEFKTESEYFFMAPEYPRERLAWKEMTLEEAGERLAAAETALEKIPAQSFKKEEVQDALAPLTDEFGRGEVYWPLRVALSGKEASPGPLELAEALGKTETIARISRAIEKIHLANSMI